MEQMACARLACKHQYHLESVTQVEFDLPIDILGKHNWVAIAAAYVRYAFQMNVQAVTCDADAFI